MPVINFDHVSLTYPREGTKAISDVSFTIHAGEFVCLIGPSGCGKTSILKIIAGLENEDEGTVERPQRVAMAFQSGALFPWLSTYENIAVGLREMKLSDHEIQRRVDKELELLSLTDYRDKYPVDLSGGQRQRVGIARALAVEPAVLLLDEPFSALDPKITSELHDDLIGLWKKRNITIVMVSHLIEEAVSLAQFVLLIKAGHLNAQYAIELDYPRREQAAEFMARVQTIRHQFFI